MVPAPSTFTVLLSSGTLNTVTPSTSNGPILSLSLPDGAGGCCARCEPAGRGGATENGHEFPPCRVDCHLTSPLPDCLVAALLATTTSHQNSAGTSPSGTMPSETNPSEKFSGSTMAGFLSISVGWPILLRLSMTLEAAGSRDAP